MSELSNEDAQDLVPVLLEALRREVAVRRAAGGYPPGAPTPAHQILPHVLQLLAQIEGRGDAGKLMPRVRRIREILKEGT